MPSRIEKMREKSLREKHDKYRANAAADIQAREDRQAVANTWTNKQALRLSVPSDLILDAILRGHVPSDIEDYQNGHVLEGPPSGHGVSFKFVD